MQNLSPTAQLTLFLCLVPIFAIFSAEKIRQIGAEEQLFLDDFIIESSQNITRQVNPVQKLPDPVLLPDKPWENNLALLFGSVIFDSNDNIFKMWYYCDGGHVAYATSRDGLHWEKPALDVGPGWSENKFGDGTRQAGVLLRDFRRAER